MEFDHVEIFVPDREFAARWYDSVLGFKRLARYADWAKTGPLMISRDDGGQMIALFKGESQEDHPVRGIRRLAFRVSAAEFIDFVESSVTWSTPPLGIDHIQDHEKAISVYFSDPFGNRLEVTTYHHAEVRKWLDDFGGE